LAGARLDMPALGLFLFGSVVDTGGLWPEQQELWVALVGAWLDMPAPGLSLFGSTVDTGACDPPLSSSSAARGSTCRRPALRLRRRAARRASGLPFVFGGARLDVPAACPSSSAARGSTCRRPALRLRRRAARRASGLPFVFGGARLDVPAACPSSSAARGSTCRLHRHDDRADQQ
jgi:hypothetical protein